MEKRKRKEDRIVSMVMVMGLALMVYSLAEHKLREAREKENEVIPDQRIKDDGGLELKTDSRENPCIGRS